MTNIKVIMASYCHGCFSDPTNESTNSALLCIKTKELLLYIRSNAAEAISVK